MKTTFFRYALILVIVSLVAAGMVSQSFAGGLNQFLPTSTPVPTKTVSPTPAVQVAAGVPVNILTFENLNTPDTALNGPYDSMTVDFSLPADWQLVDGAELRLIASASAVTSGIVVPDANQTLGATLDITFNGQPVTSVVLQPGDNREYRIPIPVRALNSERRDGRNVLYMFLNAGIDCNYTFHKTTVVINSQSKFFLPHVGQSLPLDIGLLPRPIYQKNSIVPSQAVIVVPKSSSADELRAGLVVSAGLSRMTNGDLSAALINTDGLTDTVRNNDHLIFVGKPSDFTLLTPFGWPAPVSGNQILGGAHADDGVLQMITSPWNPARVILWVGGNSDAGVVKAAQAISTGAVRPLAEPNKVIIADVKPFVDAAQSAILQVPTDRTFADLGYGVETVTGAGFNQIDYSFYVLPGMAPSERPYIDLSFSNSALVDTGLSGMVVTVNDVQVASERFDDTTATATTKRITIPTNLIRTGSNLISIQATLIPTHQCSLFTFNNLWLTVYPDSLLHMPLVASPITKSTASVLNNFPDSFISYPNLDHLAFVLPQNDPAAWAVASQIVYNLGSRVSGPLFEFGTYFDGQIPQDALADHDFFLVGLPDTLPSIAELKGALPIPFDSGNSLTVVQGQSVSYRIPANVSLGYLELFPSPWGQGRTVLTILGSNAQGLGWAGVALADPNQKQSLFGNFAVVNDKEVISADTRTGSGIPGLTTGLGAVATPVLLNVPANATPLPTPSGLQGLLTRTDYIPFIVILIFLVMAGILVWAYLSSRKHRPN